MSRGGRKTPVAGLTHRSSPEVLQELQNEYGSWLAQEGAHSDIIFSSRIRLARNLNGFLFPNRASTKEFKGVVERVKEACSNCKTLGDAKVIELEHLTEWDKKFLVERRLASPRLIESNHPTLLVVRYAGNLSIMVNEEDHLRIQCLAPGMDMRGAWRLISAVDDELEEKLEFCYSNQFGYLTSCPTNTGTGMRVSVFVHLPALSLKVEINSFLDKLPDWEIAVRGFYGEGTEPVGDIFQISNQLTLGNMETQVLDRMETIAKRLVELEQQARAKLLQEDRIKLEDEVFRAVGVLKYARMISSLESMKLLSRVRLGLGLGLIDKISSKSLNKLMVLVQPAHLQKIANKKLNSVERDEFRAKFIREFLQI
ncbi:MAG: protein arginine kinase [bacterium]